MNHLLRELAPLSDDAWDAVGAEAAGSLRQFLAARRLVEFSGPLGWEHSGDRLLRVDQLPDVAGVEARVRVVLGLVELRTRFGLGWEVLDAVDRGQPDPDLSPVVEAARRAAVAEDDLVFKGLASAGVSGILTNSPHAALSIGSDFERFPATVAQAVGVLRDAGVDGPYALALGPGRYREVVESTERGGYPLLEHVRLILGGPVVWAPAVDAAIVVSMRGGDFEIICGQDFSVGYASHDESGVQLYLEETVGVRVIEPAAAVGMVA